MLCPKVEGNEQLTGQLLAVEMPSLLATVGELKARLQDVTGLAPGKQQLSREHVGILKNDLTLVSELGGPACWCGDGQPGERVIRCR